MSQQPAAEVNALHGSVHCSLPLNQYLISVLSLVANAGRDMYSISVSWEVLVLQACAIVTHVDSCYVRMGPVFRSPPCPQQQPYITVSSPGTLAGSRGLTLLHQLTQAVDAAASDDATAAETKYTEAAFFISCSLLKHLNIKVTEKDRCFSDLT